MPWKRFKEEDKHCVYKLDADGNKDEKVDCHDSREKADEQIRALYASEDEMKSFEIEAILEAFGGTEKADGEEEELVEEESADLPSENGQDDSQKSSNSSQAEDPAHTSKAMSYNEKIYYIQDAWRDAYDYRGYVTEVFDDHVIVNMGKKAYRVPYSGMGSDVEFAGESEWREVEMKREWVQKSLYTVKALGDDRVGGWAVIFGDETEKDVHGEWFTDETEEYDVIFKAVGALPWLVHHAADNTLKSTVVGVVDTLVQKAQDGISGLWYEAKIKEHEIYKEYVQPLIDRQVLATSSGTLPAAKRVTKSGEITRWPISEVTGTWAPADWRQITAPITEVKAIEELQQLYKSAGIDPAVLEKFANGDDGQEVDASGVEETRRKLKALNQQRERQIQLMRMEL